jgi:hypothetical protein
MSQPQWLDCGSADVSSAPHVVREVNLSSLLRTPTFIS